MQTDQQTRERMDAVGRLAGKVAHDLNNLLTAISGYSQILVLSLEDIDPSLKHHASEIFTASERAGAMAQQLIAFSRKQLPAAAPICLSEVLAAIEPRLRDILGETAALAMESSNGALRVSIDPAQLGQAMQHLAMNASEAMPDGGTLAIATEHLVLDEVQAQELGLEPGGYARITVSDNGCGIPATILSRVCEPFFTTKPKDQKPSGLGLAMVYAIVTAHGGALRIESQADQGTTILLVLPLAQD